MAPGGGGEVHFSCPVRRSMKPVQLTDPGKIKRIRGTAYPSIETDKAVTLVFMCVLSVDPSPARQLLCASVSSDGQQSRGRRPEHPEQIHPRYLHLHGPHEGTELWEVSSLLETRSHH